jgi:hypothetical protein
VAATVHHRRWQPQRIQAVQISTDVARVTFVISWMAQLAAQSAVNRKVESSSLSLGDFLLPLPVVVAAAGLRTKSNHCCQKIKSCLYGPMDKAPAYGAGDSGFESRYGLFFFFSFLVGVKKFMHSAGFEPARTLSNGA